MTGAGNRYVLTSKGKKKNSNLNEHVFIFVRKRRKDEDSIQLWRRIAKTEYSDPPDTGYLSHCGQLPDGDLCADMG